jgi:hypothetical protein
MGVYVNNKLIYVEDIHAVPNELVKIVPPLYTAVGLTSGTLRFRRK